MLTCVVVQIDPLLLLVTNTRWSIRDCSDPIEQAILECGKLVHDDMLPKSFMSRDMRKIPSTWCLPLYYYQSMYDSKPVLLYLEGDEACFNQDAGIPLDMFDCCRLKIAPNCSWTAAIPPALVIGNVFSLLLYQASFLSSEQSDSHQYIEMGGSNVATCLNTYELLHTWLWISFWSMGWKGLHIHDM